MENGRQSTDRELHNIARMCELKVAKLEASFLTKESLSTSVEHGSPTSATEDVAQYLPNS